MVSCVPMTAPQSTTATSIWGRLDVNARKGIGMVIIGRDVTERKMNEEELRKSTLVLERNLKEIDRINQLLVDRELEMIALRNEITSLKTKLAHG